MSKPIEGTVSLRCKEILEIIETFREHGYVSEHTRYICSYDKGMSYTEPCTGLDEHICPWLE